jgi:Uma2 family endonuclease
MAAMKAANPRVSFAELQQWPDDGRRYELDDGQVIVVPTPFPRQQRVAAHVGDVLYEYEHATRGIVFRVPIDIVFSEYDVFQPDVVFFRKERRHLINMMQATRVPPDLAVEVLSRSTETRDRGRKMETFARFGVPEYWIVDAAANTLEIYALAGTDYRLVAVYDETQEVSSPTLPGLSFPARRIFQE